MSLLRSDLAALLLLAALPASAQTYTDTRYHLSTGISSQDQVCDQERQGTSPQCIPFAVSDTVAHTFTAMPSFLPPPPAGTLGGVKALTPTANFVMDGIAPDGSVLQISGAVIQAGQSAVAATTTLTASSCGTFISTAGGGLASGTIATLNLPAPGTVQPGCRIGIIRDGGVSPSVVPQGSDQILVASPTRTYAGVTVGSIAGDFAWFAYQGFGHWAIDNASPGAWQVLGATNTTAPARGSYTTFEANTYSPKAVVMVWMNLVLVGDDGSSFNTGSSQCTVSYTQAGPSLNGRDDTSTAQAYESGFTFVIRNPTTGVVGCVRSASFVKPAMTGALAGFTQYSKAMFWYITDNTINPYSIEGYGRQFWFTNFQSDDLYALFTGVTGTLSNTAPTWTQVGFTTNAPPNARSLFVTYGCRGTDSANAFLELAAGSSWRGAQGVGSPPRDVPCFAGTPDLRFASIAPRDEMGRTFAVSSNATGAVIQLDGFELP